MAITVYATRAQFFERLPQTALGSRTVADVDDALVTSSADMDDSFRGVYPLPFATVGASVSRRCADHARYLFMSGRGYDPQADADKQIAADEAAYQVWVDKVQRRVLFPDVTIDPTAQMPTSLNPHGAAQPAVTSYSVVDVSSGCVAGNRGW